MSNSNKRIVQADYLNGVGFGNRNYVSNPSAHRNITEQVTVTGLTLTRNTTTPLTSISDFQAVSSGAGQKVQWGPITIDLGDANGEFEFACAYKLAVTSGAVTAVVAIGGVDVASAIMAPSAAPIRLRMNVSSGTGASTATVRFEFTGVATLNVANLYYGRRVSSSSSSGGAGSASGTDLFNTIMDAKADQLIGLDQDLLLDAFNSTDKGTKFNTVQSNNALRFLASNLTGTYARSKLVTNTMASASAMMEMSIQALAPKNTAITSNTVIFTGDVTNLFTTAAKVLFVNKQNSDGVVVYQFVTNTSNNVATDIVVSSCSYNSGTNETTLVVSNPSTLTLDFGMSSSSYNTNLRVLPFNYSLQVKSAAASALETMDIAEASAMPEIGIPGENFFANLAGLTGPAMLVSAAQSNNGTYALVRVWERRSDLPAHLYHFFYTSNSGVTWTRINTTKDSGTYSAADEIDGLTNRLHDSQLKVADNGKAVCCFTYTNGSGQLDVRAVYTDLSAGTPAITDIASSGSGAGIVASSGSEAFAGWLAIDQVDCSYVSIAFSYLSGNVVNSAQYSNGGATWLSNTSSGPSQLGVAFLGLHISGSGTSHRIHLIRRDAASDGNLFYYYLDQGATTYTSGVSINAGNMLHYGSTIRNNRLIAFYQDNNSGVFANLKFATWTSSFGGSPSAVITGSLMTSSSSQSPDAYTGQNNTGDLSRNFTKLFNKVVVQNPANEKHCFFIRDIVNIDGVRRPLLFEVEDVTAYKGVFISNYSINNTYALNSSTGTQKLGQTFTASSTGQRVRTVGVWLNRTNTGVISGQASLKIYATSAGLPTTLLASSLNTLDVSRIQNTGVNNFAYFKFNSLALTNGTEYAMVLETTQALNGSNNIGWLRSSGDVYAGGQPVQYNGSVWSATGGGDFCFDINGDYITDLAIENPKLACHSSVNEFGTTSDTQVSQIALFDDASSSIQVTTRRVLQIDALRPYAGHPWRGVLSIGTPSASPSACTALTIAGYASTNVDSNILFATAMGTDACSRIQTTGTPGAISTTAKSEDRSGMFITSNAYNNVIAGDYAADTDFNQNVAQSFNGSNRSVYWDNFANHNLQATRPFILDIEMKFNAVATEACILSKYGVSSSYGWVLDVGQSASGRLRFVIIDSSGTIIGKGEAVTGTVTTGQYYRCQVRYDGAGGYPRLFLATTKNGSFTEVTYQSTTNFTGATTSTQGLEAGRHDSSVYLNGKIGEIKLAKFPPGVLTPTFNYDHWKDQASITYTNIGNRILGKRNVGQIGTTLNDCFPQPAVIDARYAGVGTVVDSNNIMLRLSKTITDTPGKEMDLQINMARTSTRDQSAVRSVIAKYIKS